jgi:predicted dehydrogenase
VELAAVVDTDPSRGTCATIDALLGNVDAAIVATPTVTHEQVAAPLLTAGVDVLLEKPIAESSAAGERLARLAQERGRILQVGHLERFNPAVLALERVVTLPLFFEIHRLSVFTPRSLDVDVVLDLMIHDLDIVLSLTRELPNEIRAAGISVLSPRVDIAKVRLSFASGCIANLTASRVSTEKVRKLRLFQPGEYISLDYQRQDALRVAVRNEAIEFESLPVERGEPLELELKAFFAAVRERSQPRVDGFQATNALRVAEAILDKIKEHADLVAGTIRSANLRNPKDVA